MFAANIIIVRCTAGATTSKVGGVDYIIRWDETKHNHTPSIEENRVTDVVQTHKQAAVHDPEIQPRKVLANIMAEVNANGGGVITASQKSLASNIHRMRAKLDAYPKLPKVFSDVVATFPDMLRSTVGGDQFLQYMGSVDGDENPPLNVLPSVPILLVFLSPWGINFLKTCSVWICDGTFKAAPYPFYQVYKC